MDIHFCHYYEGDGLPPSNRFCRTCPQGNLACNALWDLVIALSVSNGGKPVPLPGTRAFLFPNPKTGILCTWKSMYDGDYLKKTFCTSSQPITHRWDEKRSPQTRNITQHDPTGTVCTGNYPTPRRRRYSWDYSCQNHSANQQNMTVLWIISPLHITRYNYSKWKSSYLMWEYDFWFHNWSYR